MSAVVLSLGTYAGGWRIMRTLGRRIVDVDPPHGFAAETVSAAVLYAATATGAPISTTHVITSAIMGVGSTRSHKAVRWGVARSIALAWLLTFPGAGLAAAAAYALLSLLYLTRRLLRVRPTYCDSPTSGGRSGPGSGWVFRNQSGAGGSRSR